MTPAEIFVGGGGNPKKAPQKDKKSPPPSKGKSSIMAPIWRKRSKRLSHGEKSSKKAPQIA